ncbi:hypothetical protein [Brucella sp. 10RB9210]|uniref:hypothetical protein n=1 Tax=Brucella sp. 10RB9210 TaxID=1844037 RepID=UPI0012AE5AB8|nr:hypothetical protein [Brucella sp. 10RB9210]MRN79444.1 hypothetical protein [Brucella sp. 10RB9210]
MILPHTARDVIRDALSGLAPDRAILATALVVNALEDSGHRVVHYEELSGIIRGLLDVIKQHDTHGLDDLNPSVIKAKALLEILSD